MNAGKWVIVGMLTLGLAAAGAAWGYRYSQSNQAHALWETETATLIAHAPTIEAIIFKAKYDHRPLDDDGSDEIVCDATNTPGRLHFRHALLQDSTFDWQLEVDAREVCNLPDKFGLRFIDGEHIATIYFTPGCKAVAAKHGAGLKPEAAAEFRSFFNELFPDRKLRGEDRDS